MSTLLPAQLGTHQSESESRPPFLVSPSTHFIHPPSRSRSRLPSISTTPFSPPHSPSPSDTCIFTFTPSLSLSPPPYPSSFGSLPQHKALNPRHSLHPSAPLSPSPPSPLAPSRSIDAAAVLHFCHLELPNTSSTYLPAELPTYLTCLLTCLPKYMRLTIIQKITLLEIRSYRSRKAAEI